MLTSILLLALQILPSQRSNGVDISHFLEIGCKRVKTEEIAYLDCTSQGIEEKYSCLEINEVPEYFSALTPKVPLVECQFTAEGIRNKESEYVKYNGCGMLSLYSKYLVYYNGETKELKNGGELKKFFAPIESPDEALALASAMTGYIPLFQVSVPPGFVKMTETIIPSYSKSNGKTFEVRLFGYHCEGCGTHPYFFMNYRITSDGDIIELSNEPIYRNPSEDNRCQD